jgi:hypothetical protein
MASLWWCKHQPTVVEKKYCIIKGVNLALSAHAKTMIFRPFWSFGMQNCKFHQFLRYLWSVVRCVDKNERFSLEAMASSWWCKHQLTVVHYKIKTIKRVSLAMPADANTILVVLHEKCKFHQFLRRLWSVVRPIDADISFLLWLSILAEQ